MYIADAFSGNSPSWKPELAIVQYSPKMVNYSAESHDEGNLMVIYQVRKENN
jgi:hypothetical protein